MRRVRDAKITQEDYFWLCERKRAKLSFMERSRFDSAPVLMDFRRTTESNVEDNWEFHNAKNLRYHARKNKVPVVRFKALHNGIADEDGENLDDHRFAQASSVLETAEGARMLLTKNLAVTHGLINGTSLEVIAVLYAPGKHPNHPSLGCRMADCIVCDVPHS